MGYGYIKFHVLKKRAFQSEGKLQSLESVQLEASPVLPPCTHQSSEPSQAHEHDA